MAETTFNHIPVTSTNIASVAHDPATKTLEVKFKNGSVYQYDDVHPALFAGLQAAPSLGGFLHQHIKGVKTHRKVG